MKAVVELSMDFARDFGLELAALTQLAYDLYTLTMVYSG
jgi:hypothetical protein